MSSFVESRSFERLLRGIARDHSELQVVDLSGRGIGDAGVRRLAEALRSNASAAELHLGGNGIGLAGARDLSEILRTNSAITLVDLGGNNVGGEGARALAEAIGTDSAIVRLMLGDNGIDEVGARALAGMLHTNSTVIRLDLEENSIGDNGVRDLANALRINTTIIWLDLEYDEIDDEGGRALLEVLRANCAIVRLTIDNNAINDDLREAVDDLVQINRDAPNPREARRLKVERSIEWMLDYEGGAAYEAAVSLVLAELDNFPGAVRRRRLFEFLLGWLEPGADAAESVDVTTGKVLYWYAAECGAAPVVLMNLLRAHPSLIACRDVKHKLFPFMLLATLPEAKVDDVMEILLETPSLVKGGIGVPDEHHASKRARVDGA